MHYLAVERDTIEAAMIDILVWVVEFLMVQKKIVDYFRIQNLLPSKSGVHLALPFILVLSLSHVRFSLASLPFSVFMIVLQLSRHFCSLLFPAAYYYTNSLQSRRLLRGKNGRSRVLLVFVHQRGAEDCCPTFRPLIHSEG